MAKGIWYGTLQSVTRAFTQDNNNNLANHYFIGANDAATDAEWAVISTTGFTTSGDLVVQGKLLTDIVTMKDPANGISTIITNGQVSATYTIHANANFAKTLKESITSATWSPVTGLVTIPAPAGAGVSPLAGGTNNLAAGSTTYFRLGADAATGSGGSSDPTDLANGNVEDAWVAAAAGTVSAFYTYSNNAPGGGESYTVALHKNGAATAVTVTYGAADTSKNDTSNSFTVAAGDRVAVKTVLSGGASSTKFSWGLKFTAS